MMPPRDSKKPAPPPVPMLQLNAQFMQWITERAKQANMQPAQFMTMLLDLGAQLVLGFDKMEANALPPMQAATIFGFNWGRQIQVMAMYTDAKAGLILPGSVKRKIN